MLEFVEWFWEVCRGREIGDDHGVLWGGGLGGGLEGGVDGWVMAG